VLRPVRDEFGAAAGVERLPWFFTGTFLAVLAAVPAFGWLAARVPRRALLPAVYTGFVLCLLVLFGLLHLRTPWAPGAFFVWLSVFNLFVVSLFWSLMVDLWREAQARRLFGFIAAGGSAGALAGPSLTAGLVGRIGPVNLLPVAAGLLAGALVCLARLRRRPPAPVEADGGEAPALGGGALAGVARLVGSPYLRRIALFVLLATALGTVLYVQQAAVLREAVPDPGRRTRVFALVDLTVNALTIGTQVLATGRLVRAVGLPAVLGALPGLGAAGLTALALSPSVGVLLAVQVLWRAAQYALGAPAREMLFTVVSPEDKYKTKNVIDTVVYRTGDVLAAWGLAALAGFGLGPAALAAAALPLAGVWLLVALDLGRRQERLRRRAAGTEHGAAG
jgi:AAA family ATP:ADP antiporter